jgi:hypothetical protein
MRTVHTQRSGTVHRRTSYRGVRSRPVGNAVAATTFVDLHRIIETDRPASRAEAAVRSSCPSAERGAAPPFLTALQERGEEPFGPPGGL